MIKGCAKRVVVVKDIDSNFFEEAYFIVKQGSGRSTREDDYIGEAHRIVRYDLPSMQGADSSVCDIKLKSYGNAKNTVKRNKLRKRSLLRDFLLFMFGFAISTVLCTFSYYSGILI